jgi:hypothetical protein
MEYTTKSKSKPKINSRRSCKVLEDKTFSKIKATGSINKWQGGQCPPY